MIAGLEGIIATQGADHIVLNVSGVYYKVFMPGSSISQLGRIGEKAHVYTHLYVREDQMALYGTAEERQLRMFETLLGVSGIGPKVALSILSTMPVDSPRKRHRLRQRGPAHPHPRHRPQDRLAPGA